MQDLTPEQLRTQAVLDVVTSQRNQTLNALALAEAEIALLRKQLAELTQKPETPNA